MAVSMDRIAVSTVGQRPQDSGATLRRLLHYLKPYWSWGVLTVVGLAAVAAATGLLAYVIKHLLDDALIAQDFSNLKLVCGALIGLGTVRLVMGFTSQYAMSHVGQSLLEHVRNEIFAHIQHMSLSFFDRTHTGDLMSRVGNDIGILQGFVRDTIHTIVSIPLQVIVGVALLLNLSPYLTAVSFVVLPGMGLLITWSSKRMKLLAHRQQERVADLTVILQEAITGVRVIKSFAREEHEISRFGAAARRSFNAAMKGYLLQSIIKPMVEYMGLWGLGLVVFVGGRLVIVHKTMTAGDLLAYLILLGNMVSHLARIGGTLLQLQYTLASAERLFFILDTESDVKDEPGAVPAPAFQGDVQFDNVSFAYDTSKEPVLKNVTVYAQPGQITALVGPSGAGKSTFINLIPRFYDVKEGSVSIDGTDVRRYQVESLRRQIAVVPQETLLFSTTVRENIAYGKPDAPLEAVIEAAKAANAHRFIEGLPQGYDTLVGERGALLSGGQRQRIAIARAILADPKILILDEATSALDSESEKLVQQALERLMAGRTTFVIAHRLSTIRNAHRILVLENGRVAESGSHDELLDTGGLYKKLVQMQYGVSTGEQAS